MSVCCVCVFGGGGGGYKQNYTDFKTFVNSLIINTHEVRAYVLYAPNLPKIYSILEP